MGYGTYWVRYHTGISEKLCLVPAGLWIRMHFLRIRIRNDQCNGFNDQKLNKSFFLSKTAIHLSLGLHKVCPSYRRSLQLKRGHPTLQNMNFYQFFSTFVGHFCPPGSGSGFRIRFRIRIHRPDWIRIQYGSGSRIRIRIHNPGYRYRTVVLKSPFLDHLKKVDFERSQVPSCNLFPVYGNYYVI